jgi:hypothetical protein
MGSPFSSITVPLTVICCAGAAEAAPAGSAAYVEVGIAIPTIDNAAAATKKNFFIDYNRVCWFFSGANIMDFFYFSK